MPIYTVKELSALTGIEEKTIHAYASPSRKGLIKTDDGKIDTSVRLNSEFIRKKSKRNNIDNIFTPSEIQESVNEVPEIQEKPKQPTQKESKKQQRQVPVQTKLDLDMPTDKDLTKIEYSIKVNTHLKLQKEIELKEIEIQKKKGELVEMGAITGFIQSYSERLKFRLENELQSLIRDITARHSIEAKKSSEYLVKITSIINVSNKNALDDLIEKFSTVE